MKMRLYWFQLLIHITTIYAFEKIRMEDVQVITFYQNKMTTGRRFSPQPQLECIGGTAPCTAFVPKTVQCYNRGTDGYSIQWECKTDMNDDFKFGELFVSCEGYDHKEDKFTLKGSCCLKYNLDYTGEDYKPPRDTYYQSSYSSNKSKWSILSNFADMIVYIFIGIFVFVMYKTCVRSNSNQGQTAYSNTDDDYPSGGGGGGYGWFGGQNPPPYSSHNTYDNASCRNRNGGGGGGGFWTGAAAGGLLGYLFGNRGQNTNRSYWGGNNSFSQSGYRRSPTTSGGFFSSGGGGGGSSGSRVASGFGGTVQR